MQGIGRGQGVTTARTIGAVLPGAVVCSDLRSVGRDLHGVRRWPARHFSSDSRSPAVDIIRRQIAVSLLRRRPWVRPYACAQIQRGDLDDASPSHEQVGLYLMHCLLCAACPACNVFLLNALLCVRGAHACMLSCGVLLLACADFR